MKRLSHTDGCYAAASQLLWRRMHYDLAVIETAWGRGIADVVAVTTPLHEVEKSIARPRIFAGEVKVSRADLLQDLAARKMLKYCDGATHGGLFVTAEALAWDRRPDTLPDVLAWLGEAGLPSWWGVTEIGLSARGDVFVIERRKHRANPSGADISVERRQRVATRLARSLAHRALRQHR